MINYSDEIVVLMRVIGILRLRLSLRRAIDAERISQAIGAEASGHKVFVGFAWLEEIGS